jgi:hypothetical protein
VSTRAINLPFGAGAPPTSSATAGDDLTSPGYGRTRLRTKPVRLSQLDPGFLLSRALGIASTFLFFLPAALIAQQYQQTNLVSDTLAEGTTTPDPSLKNAWGIARSTTSPWWLSDKMAGVSTLYNGLEFGGGLPASDPPNQPDNALFFSAGPNKGHDGLFGTLTPVAAELTEGSDQ